ncbi:hypothetical protein [Streptomyces sioyaensis]|uniref:hypothetical protein n=1 Tax=Streptomyces sioyaensis TaxID=67364 RepID=UPI003788A880
MKLRRWDATSRLVQRAGVLGAAAALAVVGTVSTAGAATPGPGPARVLGKSELAFYPSAHGKATASSRVIHCEMVFIGANHGAPHHSGHVPGTVNVRVRVTCTKPVRMIRAKIGLFSNHGSKIKAYGSVGRAAAKGNAALVCRTGYYQGESAAQITAPPGYTPHTANMGAKTSKVHLTRC